MISKPRRESLLCARRICAAPAGFVVALMTLSADLRAQVSLPEALDTAGWEWTTSEENPFVGIQTGSARAGGDLARGVLFPDGQVAFQFPTENWMETTVEGPGVFQIHARTSDDPYLTVRMEVDGVEVDRWRPEFSWGEPVGWRALSGAIGPGRHTVRLWGCFACEDGGTLPIDNPALDFDEAALLPLDPAVGEAMDAASQLWYAAGEVAMVAGLDAHDGIDAVRSGLTEETSWVETALAGPATASWWRRGRASIRIDGLAVLDDLAAEWTRDVFFVPSGGKVVRWSDSEQGAPGERFSLDEFSSTPAAAIGLEEALDADGRIMTQGGEGTWSGAATEAAPDGEDLAWVEVRSEGAPAWLETVIEGPASLEYLAVVRGDVFVKVTANGKEIEESYGYVQRESAEWHRSLLPPGTHRVRWEASRGSSSFSASGILMLDQLTVTPLQGATLREALDNPGLDWTTGGARPWSGVVSPLAPDGEDAVVSPELVEGESAWLETTVTGPGTFSFQWQPGFEPRSERKWEVLVNGEALAWARDSFPRTVNSRFLEFGAGAHTIRWEVQGAVGGSTLVLDRAEWMPAAQPPISAALDLPPGKIHWQNGLWTSVADGGRDGGDALRFGPVGNPDTLEQLTVRVDGPAEVSFWARTGLHTRLRYYTNGAPRVVVDTEGGWERFSLQVAPGARDLHLVPVGWLSTPTLEQSVWIDELTITPNAVSIASVLDPFAPGLTWTTNPASPWVGIDLAESPDVVAAGRSLSGEASWLETQVRGPAVIRFLARGQGERSYPLVPGIRVLVDGRESATVYAAALEWRVVYLPTGSHAVRFEAPPGVRQVNPEIQRFSVAPMSGEPTVRLVDGHLEVRVPRPAGFTDARIGMSISERLGGLREPRAGAFQYSIFQSTPELIILRYDIARSGTPGTLFGAARFEP